LPSKLDYDYNKSLLSLRGQRIVDLITGEPMSWGMVVATCREIGFLPKEERGALFVVLKRELSPDQYAQWHGHYVRFVLNHRWGA